MPAAARSLALTAARLADPAVLATSLTVQTRPRCLRATIAESSGFINSALTVMGSWSCRNRRAERGRCSPQTTPTGETPPDAAVTRQTRQRAPTCGLTSHDRVSGTHRVGYYCETTGKTIAERLVEADQHKPRCPIFDAPPVPEGKRWALLHCANCGRPLAGTAPAYVGPSRCECPNPAPGVVNSG